MITIVDYGIGNIQAIANIYKRLNIPATRATTAGELAEADRIILPGVGAFDWAMDRLDRSGMRECLDEIVLRRGKPVLGICVGMQMLTDRSDEGRLPGLGYIRADVRRFDESAFRGTTHLPHMGWNDVIPQSGAPLFHTLESEARFYFLHSYYVAPASKESVLATTDYSGPFASAIHAGNVFGVQFHPEKSHQWGIQLLKNFAEM